MKLTVPVEDLVIGIICGLLLVGYAGKFFPLKLNEYVYAAAFMIYAVFILLDTFYELSDFSTHLGFIITSVLHNIVDFALSLAVISHFGKWNIPVISQYIVPYLGEQAFFYLGAFFVVGNAFWLIAYPFTY